MYNQYIQPEQDISPCVLLHTLKLSIRMKLNVLLNGGSGRNMYSSMHGGQGFYRALGHMIIFYNLNDKDPVMKKIFVYASTVFLDTR